MKGFAFLSGFISAAITLGIILPVNSQVTSDGTTNTTVNSTGNNFNILNGIQRGGNLFHSFGEFSIPTGGSATFQNSSAIENIINRVTGGNISNIDGLIKSQGSANLFLINPAGIMFGENASLDIGGSFLGTTAESILFEDGFEFSAVNAQSEPLLTISVPLGLQYGTNSSSINVSGANLTVNSGQNLALLGGDVTISNSQISAPGGQIQLGGLSETGTIQLEGLTAKFPENLTRSNITLENAANINSTSTNAGNITIDAADFSMSGSSELLAGLTNGGSDTTSVAGNITINATGNTNISGKSLIANDLQTLSVGNGGNIELNTNSLSLTGGSRIQSVTNSTGASGEITIYANSGIVIDGFTDDGLFSGILSRSATETSGTGGNITINNPQNTLTLSNRGFIGAVTNSSSNGGSIETNLNNLVMETGGQILTATTNLGNAGDITINASESVKISGESQDFVPNPFLDLAVFDLNTLEFITGFNPNVADSETIPYTSVERTPEQIVSGTTILGTAQAQVDYYSFSVTQGGSRAILDIDGGFIEGDDGSLDTNIVLFDRSTGLIVDVNDDSEATAGGEGSLPGRSGPFTLDSLIDTTLETPGFYVLAVGTFPATIDDYQLIEGSTPQVGDTYTLQVSLENQGTQGVSLPEPLNLDNFNPNVENRSGVFSNASGIGNGGTITINTPQLILDNSGIINSETFDGVGGDIILNVGNRVEINGGENIELNSNGSGNGGNLTINTQQLSMTGADIWNRNRNLGDGGNITITASESVLLESFAGIFNNVDPGAGGNGGNITVETPLLRLLNAGQISTGTSRFLGNASSPLEGDAGDLTITADSVEIIGTSTDGIFPSGLLSRSESGGEAGDLTVTTGRLLVADGAFITSSAVGSGKGGDISIVASESVEVLGNDLFGDSSAISSSASSIFGTSIEDATGDAGSLTITTERLRVAEGGRIQAFTRGAGDAGNITLQADEIEVTGVTEDGDVSAISASSTTDSIAGSINITANNLTVSDRAEITVSNTGAGDAGILTVNADNIFLDTQGSLQGEVLAGEQGNINLSSQFLLLRNGSSITTNATETANGGNININSAIIAGFENSDIVANAVEGNGGNINITTQGIFGLQFRDELTSESDITASSQFGVNGTVEINNITIDPNSGLVELLTELTDPSKQIANGCSSNNESSFVATGRGGMPQNPTEYVDLNRTWSDIRDLSAFRQQRNNNTEEITQISHKPAIVEATGLIRNEDGVIEFVVLENTPLRNKQVSECSGTNT
ncbi:MAG: filamentous hemagglutinin N-terminal domain-containing protein [Cyanobacteria bacterium J06633_8]